MVTLSDFHHAINVYQNDLRLLYAMNENPTAYEHIDPGHLAIEIVDARDAIDTMINDFYEDLVLEEHVQNIRTLISGLA